MTRDPIANPKVGDIFKDAVGWTWHIINVGDAGVVLESVLGVKVWSFRHYREYFGSVVTVVRLSS